MKGSHALLPLLAILIVGVMLASLVLDTREAVTSPIVSTKTPQLSFIPPGFKRTELEGRAPEFDPRFTKISPITNFKIPKATLFSYPLGTETGAFTYNAQQFWEDNPHRGGRHSGDDLNGIGGGNSDLGDPVYAIADGYVVYAGTPSAGWGKVIIIAHRVPAASQQGEDEIIQSLYAHLERSRVTVGETVKRGQPIGTVGTAEGQYLAHLHFEMRRGLNLYIGPGYLREPGNHISPTQFLSQFTDEQEAIFATAAQIAATTEEGWQQMEMKNADLFLRLKNEE